jgi:MoxR-like ATPase
MKAAEALGLPFVLEVVGLTSTKTDFLGFVDAGGRCTETNFKRAFLNGGVYFIDEADSANANVGIALNTAIENGICAFPDGVFKAHPDFVAIAAGNTNGKGGTAQFGGRVRMDSAFQDRFAFIEWGVDEALERDICTNRAWWRKYRKYALLSLCWGLMKYP